MLFAAIYTPHSVTEEAQKRSLQLFMNWTPPFEFKAHYARADANGGIAILEADDPQRHPRGSRALHAVLRLRGRPRLGDRERRSGLREGERVEGLRGLSGAP